MKTCACRRTARPPAPDYSNVSCSLQSRPPAEMVTRLAMTIVFWRTSLRRQPKAVDNRNAYGKALPEVDKFKTQMQAARPSSSSKSRAESAGWRASSPDRHKSSAPAWGVVQHTKCRNRSVHLWGRRPDGTATECDGCPAGAHVASDVHQGRDDDARPPRGLRQSVGEKAQHLPDPPGRRQVCESAGRQLDLRCMVGGLGRNITTNPQIPEAPPHPPTTNIIDQC